ncbi:MAG: hypothetical protein JWP81_3178 [Ferruginibacter sp.]|nr:hypothetical protein [Ferruginibacter sp.]
MPLELPGMHILSQGFALIVEFNTLYEPFTNTKSRNFILQLFDIFIFSYFEAASKRSPALVQLTTFQNAAKYSGRLF